MANVGDPALDALPALFDYLEMTPDLRSADTKVKTQLPKDALFAVEHVLTGRPYAYDDEVSKR